MMRRPWLAVPGLALGGLLVAFLLLPIVGLLLSSSPSALAAGLGDPLFLPALGVSLQTSLLSVAIIALTGTPLAWWLSRARGPWVRVLEALLDLPIVMPPAVIGVALLLTFGRQGLLGGFLSAAGLSLPFSTGAVVLAQIVVGAPFFLTSAIAAFRRADADRMDVARTLGASPVRAVWTVALPVALPGLLGGLALAWARALGEFGATLLFAGNLTGTTQTLPLAIYTALESDVEVAVALSLGLMAFALVGLFGLRLLPSLWTRP